MNNVGRIDTIYWLGEPLYCSEVEALGGKDVWAAEAGNILRQDWQYVRVLSGLPLDFRKGTRDMDRVLARSAADLKYELTVWKPFT